MNIAVADVSQVPLAPSLASSLARASDAAQAAGSGEVLLEHLLDALTGDADAVAVLDASQINIERLRTDIAAHIAQMHFAPAAPGQLGVSQDLRRILEAASAAAQGGRRRDINGAIVIAAIVGDGKSAAAQMLQAQGLTFETAIRAMQAALSQPMMRDLPASMPMPAEDVLARARERVQSRSMPGFAIHPEPKAVPPFEPAPQGFAYPPASPSPAPSRDPVPVIPDSAPGPNLSPSPAPSPGPLYTHGDGSMGPPQPQPHLPPFEPPASAPVVPSVAATLPAAVQPPFERAAPAFEPALPPPVPPPIPVAVPPPFLPPQTHMPPPDAPHPVPHASLGSGLSRTPVEQPLQIPQNAARPAKAMAARAPKAERGQLAENIPRAMRVGQTEKIEVRVGKGTAQAITHGLDGGGVVWKHDIVVTQAMSVRLRAPGGGFFIETASPETQWIENGGYGFTNDDFASWRFLVTPNERGWSQLQIIVSARTAGADGMTAETAMPDQIVEVKVKRNWKRSAVRGLGWAVAALAGGAVSQFGETGFEVIRLVVQRVLAG